MHLIELTMIEERESVMRNKMNVLLLLLTFSSVAFAHAGVYDRFNEYRHWIFPAYLYCLIFGGLFMVAFGSTFYAMRKRITPKLEQFTQFLRQSSFWSIIVCGVLWSIPLGILGNLLYLIYWFFVFNIFGIILIIFSVFLSFKRCRNTFLFYPSFLKWNIIFVMSAICASVLFIILTKCGWLIRETDCFILGYRRFFSHPYDSIIEIWNCTNLFLFGILLSLIFYWIGNGIRWLKGKIKHRTTFQKL